MSAHDARGRRVALITGASSGIGLATARALAAEGWDLTLVARSRIGLKAARDTCRALGGECVIAEADVGDRGGVDAAFEIAAERFGRIDAVVHCAASVCYGRFEQIPPDVFDAVVTANVLGTANVARIALRRFGATGGGDLVLMGSVLGKVVVPFMSPYVTSKWAVHALARMLRIEARELPGVRVSQVSPNSVNTNAYLAAGNYLGREGRPPPPIDEPEKVAAAVLRNLSAPRRDRPVGLTSSLIVLGFRVFPMLFDRLVTPMMKRAGISGRGIPVGPGSVLDPQPHLEADRGPWRRWGGRVVNADSAAMDYADARGL